jgi:glycosyltransferase involved in cell wall biosynthesis
MTPPVKVKVAIITAMGEAPYLGGIQTVVDNLIKSDLNKSYEFSIFDTFRAHKANRTKIEKAIFSVKLFISCLLFIVRYRPKIVHIHFCSFIDFWKHSICLFAAKLTGAKTVFHLHGGSFDEFYASHNNISKAVIRRIFGLSDVVIALSKYWVEFLSQLVSVDRIRLIYNPVDCELYAPGNQDQSTQKDRKSLLLMGSLGKRKGHYDALEAFRNIQPSFPDATLLFAGTDEDVGATENLKELANEYGIATNVKFLGPISGQPKIKLIQSAGIKILPSYGENMPMALLEAMSAKLPIISTRIGAIPEMLGEGKAGILITPGDVDGLSSAMIKLFSDEDYADAVAEEGYNMVKNRWDTKIVSATVSSLYSDLLDGHS